MNKTNWGPDGYEASFPSARRLHRQVWFQLSKVYNCNSRRPYSRRSRPDSLTSSSHICVVSVILSIVKLRSQADFGIVQPHSIKPVNKGVKDFQGPPPRLLISSFEIPEKIHCASNRQYLNFLRLSIPSCDIELSLLACGDLEKYALAKLWRERSTEPRRNALKSTALVARPCRKTGSSNSGSTYSQTSDANLEFGGIWTKCV